MVDVSWKTVFLSFFLICASTFCGGALTDKLAGAEAGRSFLWLGASIVGCIIALQAVLYLYSSKRLIFGLFFATSLGLTVVWFMLCLFLPLFWVSSIAIYIKISMIFFLIWLCGCNFRLALRHFNEKWTLQGKKMFDKHYRRDISSIDWNKVVNPMKLTCKLYIPSIPQQITPILSAVLLISMIAGLNFRNIFPTFSIFAWGIPASVVVSIFVQLMGLGFAQAAKIAALERKIGEKIRSAVRKP